MTAWVEYIERANPDDLRSRELGNSYNDWLAPGDDATPSDLRASDFRVPAASGRPSSRSVRAATCSLARRCRGRRS